MPEFDELDAVTLDAYGTLLTMRDPAPALRAALRERGVELAESDIRRGLAAEQAYYRAHKLDGRDAATLADLYRRCCGVFLEAAGAEVDAEEFISAFNEAFVFEPLPGAFETVAALADHGLRLAVVADWDTSLHRHLRDHGLTDRFATVVVAAEVGAAKPDPLPFRIALERLRVEPARALHVGDEVVDEQGARAAGMQFAWAPLAEAFAGWR